MTSCVVEKAHAIVRLYLAGPTVRIKLEGPQLCGSLLSEPAIDHIDDPV